MTLSSFIPNRLTVRVFIATTVIVLLFLVSTLSSGFLAWTSQNDAKAINTAGSIRMATYRLNFLLASDFEPSTPNNYDNIDADKRRTMYSLINDMDHKLNLLQQYQKQRANKNTRIDHQLQRIENRWQSELTPLLLNNDAEGFYETSLPYLIQVNALVSQLQYRNEKRQRHLQLLQMLMLAQLVLITLVEIREVRCKMLGPIKRLIEAKEKFTSGQLDTRVKIDGYYELKELGHSFNDMVSTIEHNQQCLESEVKSKTAHLTQANHVLSLLYDFAKYLTTSQVSIVELNRLIADFGKIIPELEFTLCLKNDLLDNKDAIAIHSSALRDLCSTISCDSCVINNHENTQSFDIRHQKSVFGELRVRPKSLGLTRPKVDLKPNTETETKPKTKLATNDEDNEQLNRIPMTEEPTTIADQNLKSVKAVVSDNKEAIIALTNLISTALFLLQQRQQEHQIILLEERAIIARELHDSLAQSLSYLKIQVSILEKRLTQTQCENPDLVLITDSISKIKAGLTSAYQHLRDLLVTFRLSLNDDSFDEALHNSAAEFAKKGGFNIKVNNQVMSINLNASEQVNIIQIVREALSNVCRHAEATNVEVNFSYVPDSNDTLLTISDDGKGISKDFDQTHHHGLMIMQERANSLGGKLQITQNQPKGTLVKAQFAPSFFTA